MLFSEKMSPFLYNKLIPGQLLKHLYEHSNNGIAQSQMTEPLIAYFTLNTHQKLKTLSNKEKVWNYEMCRSPLVQKD